MEVKFLETKKLSEMLKEKRISVTDVQNGILNISTDIHCKNACREISEVLSQILSDNYHLTLISLNLHEQDGVCEAIAIFVSFSDIKYATEHTDWYEYAHGLSHVCSPF